MSSSSKKLNEKLFPGLLLDNRWRLESLVGLGRMGELWKATDIRENRELALRFIPQEILHFRNELRRVQIIYEAIRVLRHPVICPIDVMVENPDCGWYFVMDWVPNQTLDAYLSEVSFFDGSFAKETALKILQPIAEALDYAHAQKVIHRDLRPTNIALTKDENGGISGVVLLDFGLAAEIRECSSRVTQSSLGLSGTPSYLSPEQWQSRLLDGRSDQYALAVIAYELFSGHLPFSGQTTEVLRASVLNDKPEKIVGADVSVNRALQKALSKSAAKRFRSCAAFVQALTRPPLFRFLPF